MSFDAKLFREMPPLQYGAFMTCPFTGLQIPKTTVENLAWRKKLLGQAKVSLAIRRTLKAASAASPIFWLNAFGWTYLQKKVQGDGAEESVQGAGTHVPFITWKVQDDALLNLLDAIDKGHDALIHKSRDMGASWLIVAIFQWYFQFRPATSFLEISRKEVLVDKRGDMDSLFEKHRYLMRMQPEWLRPARLVDNAMHLENKDIGTAIMGESTNENAGQAGRKTAMLLDEFARVRDGAEIDNATADTTACHIYNSTPQGPNTHFTSIYRAMEAKQRAGKLIILPWWQHPLKGKDAKIEIVKDESMARTIGVQVGEEYPINKWIEKQAARRSARNFAMNIRGEHGRAGDSVFDPNEIDRHRKMHVREPLTIGDIRALEEVTYEGKIEIIKKQRHPALAFISGAAYSPWRFWTSLIDGRPTQLTRYVFGVDISNGSGASNSVISVLDNSTNMIVAKFWDAFVSPEDLAEIVALAGVWFGGKRPPLVIFEKNGPGITFGKKLVSKLGYPNIYYMDVVDQKSKQKTKKWGWHSSPTKKEMLLGEYREALKLNTIINPCNEALIEAADYVYDGDKIEPGTVGAEAGGGKALHGDHVIADALLVIGRKDLPKVEKEEPRAIPSGTPAARRKERKRNMEDTYAWS